MTTSIIAASYTNITLDTCIFEGIMAPLGVIFIQNSEIYIINSTFRANSGAIVGKENTKLKIENTTFMGNIRSSGAAIYIQSESELSVYNSYFINNHANFGSAISASENSAISVKDCNFDDNVAIKGTVSIPDAGGAIDIKLQSKLIATNSYFKNNTATFGSAIAASENSEIFLTDCDFDNKNFDNSISSTYQ